MVRYMLNPQSTKTGVYGWVVITTLAVLGVSCSQESGFVERSAPNSDPILGTAKTGIDQYSKAADSSRDSTSDDGTTKRELVTAGVTPTVKDDGTLTNVEPDTGGSGNEKRNPELPIPSPIAEPVATVVPTAVPVVVVTVVPPVVSTVAPLPAVPRAGDLVIINQNQASPRALDVLWVVDNSGSMDWAQQQLSNNFESFASKLVQSGVGNFQVGVTTANVCNSIEDEYCPYQDATGLRGSLKQINVGGGVGNVRWLKSSGDHNGDGRVDYDFVREFKNLSSVGTYGSTYEHGLSAVRFAIDKSATGGYNAGFLRNNAFLSVIVVSDEEDQGVEFECAAYDIFGILKSGWNATTKKCTGIYGDAASDTSDRMAYLKSDWYISKYVNVGKSASYHAEDLVAYANTKLGAGKVQVNTITGLRGADNKMVYSGKNADGSTWSVCGSGDDTRPVEPGTNYVKAAALTNGVVENICNPNWDVVLGKIAESTVQLASKFQLPAGKIPFPGTLEVRVNNVLLAADKYVYEASGNFIKFIEVPGAGAAVDIRFNETTL